MFQYLRALEVKLRGHYKARPTRGEKYSKTYVSNRARRAEHYFLRNPIAEEEIHHFSIKISSVAFLLGSLHHPNKCLLNPQVSASYLPLTQINTRKPSHSVARTTHALPAAKTNNIPLRTDAPINSKSPCLYTPK